MLMRGYLPIVQNNNHQTPNHAIVLQICIPLVQTTHKGNIQQRPCFTSHFGHALAKELGITWNMSIAYHPQTDGLTECKNQWIGQYLRLVAGNDKEWSTLLPMATLVHNNAANSTTGLVPSQLLIGREPPPMPAQGEGSDNPLAEQ
jgi:hypothetical protein